MFVKVFEDSLQLLRRKPFQSKWRFSSNLIAQRSPGRIEEIFVWVKTVGLMRVCNRSVFLSKRRSRFMTRTKGPTSTPTRCEANVLSKPKIS